MGRRAITIRRELLLALREAGRELLRVVAIRHGARRGQAYIVLSTPRFKKLHKVSKRISKRVVSVQPIIGKALTAFLLVAGIAGLLYSTLPLLSQPKATAIVQPVIPEKPKQTPAPAAKSAPKVLPRSIPITLEIPAIGLSTNLITATQNAQGELEPPEDYTIAGWYDLSPTPGELGPSIIVGHVDSYKGNGVFFYVKTMQAGQTITITRADGSKANFVVDTIAQYDQDNFPTQAVYGNIDHAGLRIITCGGNFNPYTGRYLQNTVVYASYVPESA